MLSLARKQPLAGQAQGKTELGEEELGGVRRSQEELGGTRRNQEELGDNTQVHEKGPRSKIPIKRHFLRILHTFTKQMLQKAKSVLQSKTGKKNNSCTFAPRK